MTDGQGSTTAFGGTVLVGDDGSVPAADARRWAEALAAATGQAVRTLHAEDDHPGEALVRASREPDVSLLVVGRRGLGRVRSRVLGSVSRDVVRRSARPVVVVEGAPIAAPSQIVVGVDGTPQSEQALTWATELALLLDAEVVAVHAVGSEIVAVAGTQLRQRFHEWCQPLRDAGVRHRSVLAPGRPREELVRVAAQVGADLVVVGTRYDAGERRFLLSSVATGLVESARTPLAIVRGG